MTSDLDARVESNKQPAVEEQRAGQGQQETDAARGMDDQRDPFGRGDFFALTVSILILTFGIWWVTPR